MATLELFFFLFFFLYQPSTNGETCLETSCGYVIVDFPFRLAAQPDCCGNPSFSLSCTNQNETIISFPFAGEFSVDVIGYYGSPSLLISDPCIPKRLFEGFDLSGTPFEPQYPESYSFFNCSSNISVGYPAIHISCLSDRNYSVKAIPTGLYNESSPLRSCLEIATIFDVPLATPYIPQYYLDSLLLTWEDPDCRTSCNNCEGRGTNCQLENNDGCSSFHYKKKSGLSKRAKLAIMFSLGAPIFFLISFLVYYNVKAPQNDQRQPSNAEISSMAQPRLDGLDGARIEAYPITLLGESCRLPRPNDNTCSICLSEYQAKETIRTIPDCDHYFHANCIDEWLKMNAACPVCRSTPDQQTALINHSALSSSSSPPHR